MLVSTGFFGTFWCSHTGYHPQEKLIKHRFGKHTFGEFGTYIKLWHNRESDLMVISRLLQSLRTHEIACDRSNVNFENWSCHSFQYSHCCQFSTREWMGWANLIELRTPFSFSYSKNHCGNLQPITAGLIYHKLLWQSTAQICVIQSRAWASNCRIQDLRWSKRPML